MGVYTVEGQLRLGSTLYCCTPKATDYKKQCTRIASIQVQPTFSAKKSKRKNPQIIRKINKYLTFKILLNVNFRVFKLLDFYLETNFHASLCDLETCRKRGKPRSQTKYLTQPNISEGRVVQHKIKLQELSETGYFVLFNFQETDEAPHLALYFTHGWMMVMNTTAVNQCQNSILHVLALELQLGGHDSAMAGDSILIYIPQFPSLSETFLAVPFKARLKYREQDVNLHCFQSS